MKQENLYKIVFALFALLLAASCDKEEFTDIPVANELKPIFASGNEDKQEKVGRTLKALGMDSPFLWEFAWYSTESFSFNPQERAFLFLYDLWYG